MQFPPVSVIADVGSNHGGSLAAACQHIEAAAAAGCQAVKFQLFRAETLDSRPAVREALQPDVMPIAWLPQLREQCRRVSVLFVVTPFDPDLALALSGEVDMVKISAYDLTYQRLIHAAASLQVPMLLSTAMATLPEIWRALKWAHAAPWIGLLHGVAQYPARIEDYNLRVLATLAQATEAHAVGISDHTRGVQLAPLAVAAGAQLIEKHFRLYDTPPTAPDFWHSVLPAEMATLCREVTWVHEIMGSEEKKGPLSCELPLFTTCRRTNERPLRG